MKNKQQQIGANLERRAWRKAIRRINVNYFNNAPIQRVIKQLLEFADKREKRTRAKAGGL